jgi:hypothetical protein
MVSLSFCGEIDLLFTFIQKGIPAWMAGVDERWKISRFPD